MFGFSVWLVDVMDESHHEFCDTFVVKRTGKVVGHLRQFDLEGHSSHPSRVPPAGPPAEDVQRTSPVKDPPPILYVNLSTTLDVPGTHSPKSSRLVNFSPSFLLD